MVELKFNRDLPKQERMKFNKTEIEGLIILEPTIFRDDRGMFMETFNTKALQANGIDVDFVQDNQSLSQKGVIRGLHFQKEPYAQGKLVRVIAGAALDVVVDIRPKSATFGRALSIELNAENKKILWIPPGFAHGFESLEDDTIFLYKVSRYYHKESESGILYNDTELGIKWRTKNPIVSDKDLELSRFKKIEI